MMAVHHPTPYRARSDGERWLVALVKDEEQHDAEILDRQIPGTPDTEIDSPSTEIESPEVTLHLSSSPAIARTPPPLPLPPPLPPSSVFHPPSSPCPPPPEGENVEMPIKLQAHFCPYKKIMEFECAVMQRFRYYSQELSPAAHRFLEHNCRTRDVIPRKRSAADSSEELRLRDQQRRRQARWHPPRYSDTELRAWQCDPPHTDCVLCECLGVRCHVWRSRGRGNVGTVLLFVFCI